MGIVTKAFGVVLGAVVVASVGAGHASAAESGAGRPSFTIPPPSREALAARLPLVAVACATSGGGQEIAKTPVIRNTTSVPLAKGTAITWVASDGDEGTLVLDQTLAPGATAKAQGTKPGNAYSCHATYLAKPDLVVKRAYASGPMQVTIDVANADPFADAAPSKVRLAVGLCQGGGGSTVESAPIAIPRGQTRSVTLAYGPLFGDVSFVATADAEHQVSESFEQNNVWAKPLACAGK